MYVSYIYLIRCIVYPNQVNSLKSLVINQYPSIGIDLKVSHKWWIFMYLLKLQSIDCVIYKSCVTFAIIFDVHLILHYNTSLIIVSLWWLVFKYLWVTYYKCDSSIFNRHADLVCKISLTFLRSEANNSYMLLCRVIKLHDKYSKKY